MQGKKIFKGVIDTVGFVGTFPAKKLTDAVAFIAHFSRLNKVAPPVTKKNVSIFFTALIPAALVSYFMFKNEAISTQAAIMGGIFVLACLLWATEALPLFATALLIMGLEVLLLSNPAGWAHVGMPAGEEVHYSQFLRPLADPIIILFLGGFLLARASVKAGVDELIAAKLLKPFLSTPKKLMLGIILITAVFSMWMSNTATTAMMLSLLAPILVQIEDEPHLTKGLILAVPIAANLGGMGTPVASPPNAVAVGYLSNLGYQVNFSDWVLIAMPIVLIMLFIAWKFLMKKFPPIHADRTFEIRINKHDPWANYVLVIFGLTIMLWLTEALHGIPAPVISFVPLIAFTSTGLIDRSDINSLEWNILILIAGGIALGMGMSLTGLDKIIVQSIQADSLFLVPVLLLGMLLLSNFMSNTAASNLLIPIGISMMQVQEFGKIGIFAGTIAIALAASMAMALPVSTPPNALAYSSGKLKSEDFRASGIFLGAVGLLLLIILFSLAGFSQKLGLLPE
jgi:sodium-dependent dicarboxylate transporter 2/3/5